MITLGVGSTEPTLLRLLQRLEALGCDGSIVGLVEPTGHAFNIDGVCIYMTMAPIIVVLSSHEGDLHWMSGSPRVVQYRRVPHALLRCCPNHADVAPRLIFRRRV